MLGFSSIIRDPYAVMTLLPGTYYKDRAYFRVNGAPLRFDEGPGRRHGGHQRNAAAEHGDEPTKCGRN